MIPCRKCKVPIFVVDFAIVGSVYVPGRLDEKGLHFGKCGAPCVGGFQPQELRSTDAKTMLVNFCYGARCERCHPRRK